MKNRCLRVLAMAMTAALIISGSGSFAAKKEAVKLQVHVWTGTNQDVVPREVIANFVKKNPNVKIEITEGNNNVLYPQMVAALKTTPDQPLFNTVYCNGAITARGIADGMWMHLDKANIPNANKIYDEFKHTKGNYGVIWSMGEVSILYNTDKVKNPPKSWKELWSNPKYKGHVVLMDNLFYSFLIMAARLNGGSESNIDPGFKVWAEHADMIHSFVTSLDQIKNAFISGDAWICPHFVGQQMAWAKEGAPVASAKLAEGVIAVPYYLQVCSGTTKAQKVVAEKLINAFIDPVRIGRFVELSNVIPLVKGVKEMANNWFFSKEAIKHANQFDWEVLGKNDANWRERWAEEVKTKIK
jgi:putative spermidine/putrescine transport system substrate-binding protein